MKYSEYQESTNHFFEDLLSLGSTLGYEYHQKGQAYLATIIEKARRISAVANDAFIMTLEEEYANDPDFVKFKDSEFCKKLVSEFKQSGYCTNPSTAEEGYA